MPYQPTSPYPYNTGIDVTEGLQFYFKVDNYDKIEKFKIEIYDLFKNEKIYTIVRSVGEISNQEIISGDKQLIEIYDENEERVYLSYYELETALPTKGGYGLDSVCELDVTGYLVTLQTYEKKKYYGDTTDYEDLKIVDDNLFTYDEKGTTITGVVEGFGQKIKEEYNNRLVIPYRHEGNSIIGIADGDSNSNYQGVFYEKMEADYEVVFPSTIYRIGNYAFMNSGTGSYGLTKITFNYGNTIIGSRAFAFSKITKLRMLDSIKEVEEGAFYHTTTLKECRLSYSLTKLDKQVFTGCESLNDVKLPNNIEIIGNSCFEGCSSLDNISFNKKLKKISESAFGRTGFTYLKLPEGVEEIGRYAFMYNENLQELSLPTSLKKIEEAICQECSSLTKITMPFIGVNRQDSKTATSVLGYLFSDGSATADSSKMLQLNSLNNTYYYSVPYETEVYAQKLQEVNITDARIIPYGAFSNFKGIKTITLNEGIITLEDYSFYNCEGLTQLSVPSSVTYVGDNAFGLGNVDRT